MPPGGEEPTFDTVVAIVERASGTALTGPTREFCREEYASHPTGVQMCATEAAWRRGVRTPNGLFVKMLRDGDHIRHEAAWDSVAAPAPSGDGEAPTRDVGRPGSVSREAPDQATRAALERLGEVVGVEPDRLLRPLDPRPSADAA